MFSTPLLPYSWKELTCKQHFTNTKQGLKYQERKVLCVLLCPWGRWWGHGRCGHPTGPGPRVSEGAPATPSAVVTSHLHLPRCPAHLVSSSILANTAHPTELDLGPLHLSCQPARRTPAFHSLRGSVKFPLGEKNLCLGSNTSPGFLYQRLLASLQKVFQWVLTSALPGPGSLLNLYSQWQKFHGLWLASMVLFSFVYIWLA